MLAPELKREKVTLVQLTQEQLMFHLEKRRLYTGQGLLVMLRAKCVGVICVGESFGIRIRKANLERTSSQSDFADFSGSDRTNKSKQVSNYAMSHKL